MESDPQIGPEGESLKALVNLIDLDYQRTTAFIESIVGTGTTIRGWGVTLWLGLLGFAIDRHRWQLAMLAGVVTVAIALADAYHASLYRQALDHARMAENISARYFALLNHGDDDPDAESDLRVQLAGYRYGLYTNLWKFRLRDAWNCPPVVFFRVIYPLLVAGAGAAALYIKF
ncbi:MAG: hypothetical protein ACR2KK_23160 [Acidimicrobiales bacterium]